MAAGTEKRKMTVDLIFAQALLARNGKQGPVLGLTAHTGNGADARHLGFPARLDELPHVFVDSGLGS
jgi:hypothetical protein